MTDYEDRLKELDPYLLDSVRIIPELISDEYVRVPSDLAYWNARYAQAAEDFARAKHTLDLLRARLVKLIREEFASLGLKPNESQVDAAIEAHPDCIASRENVTSTERTKLEMYGNVDAVRTKRDMLVSLGAHLRAEMEHDPVIRERMAGRRVLDGQRSG